MKLLSSTFGFVITGPVGAMLSAALGQNFSLGFGLKTSRSQKTEEQRRAYHAFFVATFQVMGHLAKVDGPVSEHEIGAAQAVMTHLGLTPAQRRAAILLFDNGKHPSFVLDSALHRFQNECRYASNLVRKFMEIQLSMAYADGMLHPKERAVLLFICNQLGFSRVLFEALETFVRNRYRSNGTKPGGSRQRSRGHRTVIQATSLSEAYAILGLKRTATNDEVKKAYRRLINRHHPDKLMATSASGETMARATEKTREIKMAYDRIKLARGF